MVPAQATIKQQAIVMFLIRATQTVCWLGAVVYVNQSLSMVFWEKNLTVERPDESPPVFTYCAGFTVPATFMLTVTILLVVLCAKRVLFVVGGLFLAVQSVSLANHALKVNQGWKWDARDPRSGAEIVFASLFVFIAFSLGVWLLFRFIRQWTAMLAITIVALCCSVSLMINVLVLSMDMPKDISEAADNNAAIRIMRINSDSVSYAVLGAFTGLVLFLIVWLTPVLLQRWGHKKKKRPQELRRLRDASVDSE